MSDNNVNENTETMADALKSVTTVKIGDTVKADVLAVEDKQLIVGIEGTGVEGVVPIKELSTQQSMTFTMLQKSATSLI